MYRHIISLAELSADDVDALLTVASYLKARSKRGILEKVFAGKHLAMIFEKPSLRTRLSFEMAMVELGGHATYIRGEEIGLNSREPVQDVARVLSRMVHGIMIRTFAHQNVVDLAKYATVPVINGLSDSTHPCQALADALTMREHFGPDLKGLKVVFVGDGNNVSRSLARICVHVGARFVLAAPKAYQFTDEDRVDFGAAWGSSITQTDDITVAASGADVLYSDVWTSMGQEAEKAKRLADFAGFSINAKLLKLGSPRCKIMHCLPAHRGEEIDDEAMECPASIVFDQAENRLHAQKAVLRLLMGDDRDSVIAAARA